MSQTFNSGTAGIAEMAGMAEVADMADIADIADRADMADRANSRVILPTMAYIDDKSEIMTDWPTHSQYQLQGDAIASKNCPCPLISSAI